MKRSRAPNFNNREIMELLLLVEKYPIIENKKTDGATSKEKQDAWKELTIEYNSITSGVHRTTENLVACYKNQKIKVKKQHSCKKMEIIAPSTSSQSDDVHVILDAVESNGLNWDLVSQSTKISANDCKAFFDNLAKNAKKEETIYLKEIKRTGGGPPPQPPNDAVHEKVKTLIGPSLEGLYTSYGGDFEFMQQQQELLPPEKKMDLLEQINYPDQETQKSDIEDSISTITPSVTKNIMPKRLNILKSKVDPSLDVQNRNKGTRKNASSSFVELAEDKKELIRLKKELAVNQLKHQQELHEINVQIGKENLKFTQMKNEMEIKFLKEKHELWKCENIIINNSNKTDT